MTAQRILKTAGKIVAVLMVLGVATFYALMYTRTGTEPLRQLIKGAGNHCPGDGGTLSVDFVGHMLSLPAERVFDCRPRDMTTPRNHDPAMIELAGSLPRFGGLAYKPGQFLAGPEELRINLTGTDPKGPVSDIPVYMPAIKFTANDAGIRKVRLPDGTPLYEAPVPVSPGTFVYRSRKGGPAALDLYVHRNADGLVDYMLECTARLQAAVATLPVCVSGSLPVYDNVEYRYAFALEQLPNAEQIYLLAKTVVASVLPKIPADAIPEAERP